jgi:ABC-type multidrug transport system ATPase subunit
MSLPLLTFENLGKQFGHQWAVHKASGEVLRNQYISLFGANGAGKSTLLYLLSGVYRPHEGTVNYNLHRDSNIHKGNEKNHPKKNFSQMHLMSHHSMFYNRLTGEDNLTFFHSLTSNIQKKEIKSVLEYTGLYHHRFKTVDGYSRGMIQRLMIARLILSKASLIFFDEPFTGLDIQGQKLLEEILETRGLKNFNWNIDGFVFVDHDLERAYRYADNIWFIEPGKLHSSYTRSELALDQIKDMLS